MAVIHVLDKHTAELIAAGEVVERPASVVKELTENAVDAGATQVTVSIVHGGIKSIEIADNGSGIDAEYIPTAFIRHATSKIEKEADLDAIHTLGFRGEALASIASVSRVTLLTKTDSDEFASVYRISGGEEEGIEAGARGVGTTITVEDLFYNTPARMKFLKKDISEGNTVAETVGRLALSHPEVAFTFVREGKVQFRTPGDGQLRAAVYAVLSREFGRDLVQVQYTESACTVSGLATPPKAARASRAMQYFYINGRYVKNRTMMAALEQAYRGMMMQGRFPGCVLFLQMPTEAVDVNVHPAKTEVRFANDKEVFNVVYAAVRSVLMTPESSHRELDFTAIADAKTPSNPSLYEVRDVVEPAKQPHTQSFFAAPTQLAHNVGVIHSSDEVAAKPPEENTKPTVTPLVEEDTPLTPVTSIATHKSDSLQYKDMLADGAVAASGVAVPYKTEPLPDVPYTEEPEVKTSATPEQIPAAVQQALQQDGTVSDATDERAPLQYVGEVFRTYIIAQRGDEVCFIDKHAAHERSIYQRLCATRRAPEAQLLLAPVTVQLSAEEKNALADNAELLTSGGLDVEDFGGNAVILRSVPSDIVPQDAENLLIEIARRLADNQRSTMDEKTEWVMHSIACRAAMKAGDKTNAQQLVSLAQQVLDGEIPPFCPHGRPVVLKVTKKELEKQFGRLG